MEKSIVQFLRRRDYQFVRELGQGACGITVLLRDELLDENFVCKKYQPVIESQRQQLYENFIREIKLLHDVLHNNVIRIFNYYVYPDKFTGYILMEYVEGKDIQEWLKHAPEQTNELFTQAIDGFHHLESKGILHRDIRPSNILVKADGTVKIIDFGFGKQVEESANFDKSISLNWWCDPPYEFAKSIYDFRTEVYFVGKLFEQLIQEQGVQHFKYAEVLGRMYRRDAAARISSFAEVQRLIETDPFLEIGFNSNEIQTYRDFADALAEQLAKIQTGTKYVDDLARIRTRLEAAHRNCMLEEWVPNASTVLSCFIDGAYRYRSAGFPVSALKSFLKLMKSLSEEKQRIVVANIQTRLDAIERYDRPNPKEEDDIPF